MNQGKINLFIVDDHALFRKGLVNLLSDFSEFKIVGEASNGDEALRAIRDINTDIVLMDLNMPVMDGVETVKAIRSENMECKIVMLTISKEDEDLINAIRAGADGYLLKNTEPEELHSSLLKVASGQGVLSPEVTAPVMKALASQKIAPREELLTEREIQVLECIAEGQTTQQVAQKLYISENTVKTHIRHIFEKLEATNRTEAVTKAIQLNLIQNQ